VNTGLITRKLDPAALRVAREQNRRLYRLPLMWHKVFKTGESVHDALRAILKAVPRRKTSASSA
jgi:hypothetical protein